jgi:hypothetical protein
LLQIGFDAGEDLGLVLAGGYALAAYELVDRPSKDIDFGSVHDHDVDIFVFYGLDEPQIAGLRQWATDWESDIRRRLEAGETGPAGLLDSGWDTYLDER